MNAQNTLGNKLYELRKQSALSQEEFAEKLNVSRQAVSKWECGDALPDTENLIKISKLYGVSLDELVGNTNTEQAREPEQESNDNANTDFKNTHKTGIHIGEDGVHIGGEDGIHITDDSVHVGGIHINDDSVHVGGIHIEDGHVHFGKEDVNINVQATSSSANHTKKDLILRLLIQLPYPILITIAYLLWGFLWNGWAIGWTLYVTVPVYYSLLDCIKKKKASHFAYPVLVTFIYLFVGMQWGFWHPNWILFITIPIYYAITDAIEKM